MEQSPSLLDRVMRYCLENKLVVGLVIIMIATWGTMVAPFDWKLAGLPRDPVDLRDVPFRELHRS